MGTDDTKDSVMMRWLSALAGSGLVALSVVGVTSTADAEAAEDALCAGVASLAVADLTSDLAQCVREGFELALSDGTTIVAPEPGMVASVHSLRSGEVDRGTVDEGSVYFSEDSEIAVAENDVVVFSSTEKAQSDLRAYLDDLDDEQHLLEEPESDGVSTAATTKCNNSGAYELNSKWQGRRYQWYYNGSGAPSVLATSQTTAASAGIDSGRSSTCGSRANGLTMSYEGTTTLPSNVTSTGCGERDRQNTFGWGPLESGVLGRACTTNALLNSFKTEVDIKLSTRVSWYVGSSSTSCSGNRFDVQGVAVHEFGHAAGLAHVAQNSQQVMRPSTATCNTQDRQLGRGDQTGLRSHYDAS